MDKWTWSDTSLVKWRQQVDERLAAVFGITIEDAGLDESLLVPHWRAKQSPYEFVEWLGIKYHLTEAAEISF